MQNVGGDHEESHGSNRLHLNNRRKPLTRSRKLRYGPVKLKHYNVDRGESPLLNVGTTIEGPLTSDQMLELACADSLRSRSCTRGRERWVKTRGRQFVACPPMPGLLASQGHVPLANKKEIR